MSRFFSEKYAALTPYTPGEQPSGMEYVKLNTNESPYAPDAAIMEAVRSNTRRLNLYSDPDAKELTAAVAKLCDVAPEQVLLTNGSDEILNFAFMAFCDAQHPAAFADITYGFYPVFARLNHVPYEEIPLKEDFSLDPADYMGIRKTIFIANPNAPTGKLLPRSAIEKILQTNPDNVVIIDEAYVDFGGESCIPLIRDYPNLLVTQTFSKSRSMAGARLGFGVGSPELIRDLNTIKYSTNPYNINSLTMAAALAMLQNEPVTRANCAEIQRTRAYTVEELRKLGFEVLDSAANFVFARTAKMDGEALYLALKERGVLVRHFTKERICQFNRITIGTKAQMDALLTALRNIPEVMQ